LNIPSPEELGIGSVRQAEVTKVDWTAARAQLDRLGATCFQVQKLEGRYRFTCLLPTGQAGRNHRIEAEASTEADAVQLALAKAEDWAAGR
jgi:hypothetical protein